MGQEIKVGPSEDLAYWIGAMQADGCFRRYYRKHKGRFEYRLAMDVATKSLPMLEKVAKLSFQIFGKTSKIYKRSKGDTWDYLTVVKRLLPLFEDLDIKFGDPPKPPEWVVRKSEFFGAYLAGVIDGDGDIRIKRPKYPQCAIRITSGHEQSGLKKSVLTILGCSVSLTKCQR